MGGEGRCGSDVAGRHVLRSGEMDKVDPRIFIGISDPHEPNRHDRSDKQLFRAHFSSPVRGLGPGRTGGWHRKQSITSTPTKELTFFEGNRVELPLQ